MGRMLISRTFIAWLSVIALLDFAAAVITIPYTPKFFTPYSNVQFAIAAVNGSFLRFDAILPDDSYLALVYASSTTFGTGNTNVL